MKNPQINRQKTGSISVETTLTNPNREGRIGIKIESLRKESASGRVSKVSPRTTKVDEARNKARRRS